VSSSTPDSAGDAGGIAPGGAAPTSGGWSAPSGPAGARAGIGLAFHRQPTSKKMLEIAWDYPASLDLPKVEPGSPESTRVQPRMVALPREEAIAHLNETDKRPLLVLRECQWCRGTDDALLSRDLDNEKTKLLSRWFHCVKLRPHVLDPEHRFHNLFGGESPPHLFLASADGSNVVPFDGRQSAASLWEAMSSVLRREYGKDPEVALRELRRLLDRYDHLESLEIQLREQLDAAVEAHGPASPKTRRVRARLEAIEREKAEAKAREAEVSDLDLKNPA